MIFRHFYRYLTVFVCASASLLLPATAQNSGDGFDTLAHRYVDALAARPAGRIIGWASFTSIAGQFVTSIARLNVYGSLDSAFSTPSVNNPGGDSCPWAAACFAALGGRDSRDSCLMDPWTL